MEHKPNPYSTSASNPPSYGDAVMYPPGYNPNGMQPTQPMQPMHPMQPMQPMHPMQPMQPMHPMQPIHPMQPMQPMQPIHNNIIQMAPQAAAPANIQNVIVNGGGNTCRFCNSTRTRPSTRVTLRTHLAFLLCFLAVATIPCSLFVYCCNSCREPVLECASCGRRI